MREGAIGGQYERLTEEEINAIHEASLQVLWDPGISVENEKAKEIFKDYGATIAENGRAKIPSGMVEDALEKVPKVVKLGARKEENTMVLDGKFPRSYFVTGGCATKLVEFETRPGELKPVEKQSPMGYASLPDFVRITRLIEQLENIDGLSRAIEPDVPENLQDPTKAFLYLNNTTKHCCLANLVDINSLSKVIKIAEIVAGGKEALRENPLISFTTCLTVSPLRLVEDTTEKFIQIVKEKIPVTISTDPQALSTSPVDELGQLIQSNAEILSAIVLSQLINAGAPVLYGLIPISTSMKDLSAQWGTPEDFARLAAKSQLARFYSIPCYGTAGVPDVSNIEKPSLAYLTHSITHSYLLELMGGAQYIHNAFGLYNIYTGFAVCPELYIIGDEILARVKFSLRKDINENFQEMVELIREAIGSDYATTFLKDGRKKGRKLFYRSKFFQDSEISWERAFEIKQDLLSRPVEHLPENVNQKILEELLELKNFYPGSE